MGAGIPEKAIASSIRIEALRGYFKWRLDCLPEQ